MEWRCRSNMLRWTAHCQPIILTACCITAKDSVCIVSLYCVIVACPPCRVVSWYFVHHQLTACHARQAGFCEYSNIVFNRLLAVFEMQTKGFGQRQFAFTTALQGSDKHTLWQGAKHTSFDEYFLVLVQMPKIAPFSQPAIKCNNYKNPRLMQASGKSDASKWNKYVRCVCVIQTKSVVCHSTSVSLISCPPLPVIWAHCQKLQHNQGFAKRMMHV